MLSQLKSHLIITRHFIEDLVSAVKLFPLARLVLSEVSINERHRVELPRIFHLDFYRELDRTFAFSLQRKITNVLLF